MGVEPLDFRRKVESEMRFNLVVHDPDALVNIIDQQRRDQAVIGAIDAASRQTANRRDARSVAAAETKLQGNAADKHDANQSTKTAWVKAERNRRYHNNECFAGTKLGHKQKACPNSQQRKAGKGVHGESHGHDLKQQQQNTGGPAQHTRSKATRTAPASATPTAGASGTKPPQKRWFLLRLRRLCRRMTTTCTFAGRGKRWCRWIPGSPRWCSTVRPRAPGRKMPHQSFNQFRCGGGHPRGSSGWENPAPFRCGMIRSCSLSGSAIRELIRWTSNRI